MLHFFSKVWSCVMTWYWLLWFETLGTAAFSLIRQANVFQNQLLYQKHWYAHVLGIDGKPPVQSRQLSLSLHLLMWTIWSAMSARWQSLLHISHVYNICTVHGLCPIVVIHVTRSPSTRITWLTQWGLWKNSNEAKAKHSVYFKHAKLS